MSKQHLAPLPCILDICQISRNSCVLLRFLASTRPSLATVILQRRRQLSRSSRQPQSEPVVEVALTEAEQQQLQQDNTKAAEDQDRATAEPVPAELAYVVPTTAQQGLAQSTDIGMSISAGASI